MAIAFTPEQETIIQHREGNVLVSAAAGSGKTAVLVERIVQMILDPNDPVPVDQILVVTFTNAAARQMKEKIRQRIEEALDDRPEDLFLEEQYHAMAVSSIMTLHAFCLRIMEEYITRIPDLDPGFRVADETEMLLLKTDVLAAVLERFYTEALKPEPGQESQDFLAFMEAFGGSRRDNQVEERLLSIYQFMQSDPDPMGWLARSVAALDPDTWHAPREGEQAAVGWSRLVEQKVQTLVQQGWAAYQALDEQFARALQALHLTEKELARGQKLRAALDEAWDAVHFEAAGAVIAEQCSRIAWPRMSYDLFKEDPQQAELAKQTVSRMKEAVGRCGSFYASFYAPEAQKRQRELVLPAARGMAQLIRAFDAAYQAAKHEKNLVEFADFEHHALAILQDAQICADLRDQYRYIYIDEYQDSSPIQEAIIEKIARKTAEGQSCNVFMVGDIKQSIYRFRQADPTLFLEKYQSYDRQAVAPRPRLLVLSQNFRSSRSVIAAVNDIFEALMQTESAEMEYGDDQRLRPGLAEEAQGRPAELWVLEAPQGEDSQAKIEAEAALTARQIESLLAEGYAKRDIVILLRSIAQQGEIYRKALAARGIEAYTESSENFYDTLEVRTVLNLLHIIDNPRQDIPLMGVLHSPMVGLSAAQLGQIRLAARQADFYEALLAFAQGDPASDTVQKVKRFLNQLSGWREAARRYTVHDLLWKLYRETQYDVYVSSMPGGALRRANLDLLLEKSIAFEKGMYSGLYQFLRYIEKIDKNRKTQEEAKILGEEEDLVRIMTIHKSKGLEFPIVFVAGLGREFNRRDQRDALLLHAKLGIGVDAVDAQHYVRYKTATKAVLQEQLQKEMIAEEMRLLYVAMTRAQKQLIMVGTRAARKEEPFASCGPWKMPPEQALQAKCYLDFLLPILQHNENIAVAYHAVPMDQLPSEEDKKKAPDPVIEEAGELQETEQIEKRLSWQYPNAWASRVPLRLTVSQIKTQRRWEEEEDEKSETAYFIAESASAHEPGGALRGTALHTVLAQADLIKLREAASCEAEIQRLVTSGNMSADMGKLVNRSWLQRFAASSLCDRMVQSQRYYRERPFMMRMSLAELAEFSEALAYGGRSADGKMNESLQQAYIMVQGMIDCYFEEAGGLVLVDYKTDWILDEEKIEGYAVQLRLYERALTRALQKPVVQRILYDVRRGKEIEC